MSAQQLYFLKRVWSLFANNLNSDFHKVFNKISLMKFLPEEIFDKLSFETNLTELISYCKSEDEIVECFNAAVKRINEDWTLFTPKVKSKLLIGIETFGL